MTDLQPQSTKDWTMPEVLQILIYGRSKVGKTWGALTFPRPCVMDFDRGIATSNHPEFIKQYGKRDILYHQFYDTKRDKGGVPLNHNALDDASRFFDEMMKPENVDRFDTWVVDTGTTLSEASMNKAIILLGGGGFYGITSKTHTEAKKHGLVVPKIQDYGSERSMVEQFVQMVKDSGKHFIFICHEKERSDKAGNLIDICPLLTGKGVEAVMLKFDEVYSLKVEGNVRTRQRTLLTDSDGIRVAGSRYGIPAGTEWNYDSIKSALDKLRAQNLKTGN